MKKVIIFTALCGLLIFAGPSWSLTMSDVGSVDTLIASSDLGSSGDSVEITWVNSVLGTSYTTADLTKYSSMSWQAVTDASGVYAIDFQANDPGYFYIKTGKINSGSYAGHDIFLYDNIASLDYGVVSLAALGVDVENIGKISHIGEVGRDTQVPEPATMLLLGLGLVGLAGMGRRLRK